MARQILVSLAALVAMWVAFHLFAAFVDLEWSLFTEWHPASRGLLLLHSAIIAIFIGWSARK